MPASLFIKTPSASFCETAVPTASEGRLYPREAVLSGDLVPGFFDRSGQHPDELDCEQQNTHDHSAHDSQPEHENGALRSSSPPEQLYELMPKAVHRFQTSNRRIGAGNYQ
jgi:hypothetical protein